LALNSVQSADGWHFTSRAYLNKQTMSFYTTKGTRNKTTLF